MKVQVLQHPNLPQHQTEGAAGMDLHAVLDEPITLGPLDRWLVPTNLKVSIPTGYAWLICPRSGLALKKGLTVLNAPGVIDSDYRGDVGVVLINLSREDVVVEPGDRVAQALLVPHERVEWVEVDTLDDTIRGEGGFGSTNKEKK